MLLPLETGPVRDVLVQSIDSHNPSYIQQYGGHTSLPQDGSVHVARMNLSVSADVPLVDKTLQSPEARHAVDVLQHMLYGSLGLHGTSLLGAPSGK